MISLGISVSIIFCEINSFPKLMTNEFAKEQMSCFADFRVLFVVTKMFLDNTNSIAFRKPKKYLYQTLTP